MYLFNYRYLAQGQKTVLAARHAHVQLRTVIIDVKSVSSLISSNWTNIYNLLQTLVPDMMSKMLSVWSGLMIPMFHSCVACISSQHPIPLHPLLAPHHNKMEQLSSSVFARCNGVPFYKIFTCVCRGDNLLLSSSHVCACVLNVYIFVCV